MVLGAHFSEENAQAIGYGWQRSAESAFDWQVFMTKKDAEISRLNGIYGNMLKSAGVDVILGRGSLQGAHEVLVEKADGSKQVLTADNIVLCVGGWPYKPSIPGAELCITSNEVSEENEGAGACESTAHQARGGVILTRCFTCASVRSEC